MDTEADRKYFAAELAKREVIIDDLAREKHSKNSSYNRIDCLSLLAYQDFGRDAADKMKLLQVNCLV